MNDENLIIKSDVDEARLCFSGMRGELASDEGLHAIFEGIEDVVLILRDEEGLPCPGTDDDLAVTVTGDVDDVRREELLPQPQMPQYLLIELESDVTTERDDAAEIGRLNET